MTIHDRIRTAIAPYAGENLTARRITELVLAQYPDTNPTSLCIAGHSDAPGPSNRGWCCQATDAQLLKMVERGLYKVLGSREKARTASLGRGASFRQALRAPRPISPPTAMSDPLAGFDWPTLYRRYEESCRGLDPYSEHLREMDPRPTSDRELYQYLVENAAPERRSRLTVGWLEAMLYWKLYSQPAAVSNIKGWLRGFPVERLRQFSAKIPQTIPRDGTKVVDLVKLLDYYRLPGMASTTALPVRTTFLHMFYPNVIPIFDKMVLKAVGAWSDGANQDIGVFREYVPHAWSLADRHAQQLVGFSETPLRLADMALWVSRGRS
jgi:hypothetical protein